LQAKLIQEAVFGTVARDQASPSSDVDLFNRRRPLGVADCYDFA
jgi:predicted nucleotidyltransferase